jgi:hypothetical protein
MIGFRRTHIPYICGSIPSSFIREQSAGSHAARYSPPTLEHNSLMGATHGVGGGPPVATPIRQTISGTIEQTYLLALALAIRTMNQLPP